MKRLSAILLVAGIIFSLGSFLTYSWIWIGLNRHSIEGWKLLLILSAASIALSFIVRRVKRHKVLQN